jgi:hypothetical protein
VAIRGLRVHIQTFTGLADTGDTLLQRQRLVQIGNAIRLLLRGEQWVTITPNVPQLIERSLPWVS